MDSEKQQQLSEPQQQQEQEQQQQHQQHQQHCDCQPLQGAGVSPTSGHNAPMGQDTSHEHSNSSNAARPYKRQVSFPSDDAIAVVHHLHPSSSAGDLSTRHEEPDPAPPAPPGCCWRFKAAVKQLKRDVLALYYAVHDPRTPWLAKLLPWLVLAYALSPIDLIPDFIPVLGFLDDMLLLPLGLWLSCKLIPAQVMEDSRDRAAAEPLLLHKNWAVATLIFVLWCAGLLLLEHALIVRYGSVPLQLWRWEVLAGTGLAATLLFLVWALLRVQHEQQRRRSLDGPLLAPDGSSDEGEV